jgi:hypothetical protein
MAKMNSSSALVAALILILVLLAIYLMDPTFFGLIKSYAPSEEGYEDVMTAPPGGSLASGAKDGAKTMSGEEQKKAVLENPHVAKSGSEGFAGYAAQTRGNTVSEGFEDVPGYDNGADFAPIANAGCMQKEQLTPSELLPKDMNSVWAEQAPMTGSLKGKQFLSAGSLIGIDTVGSSKKNANLQLRSEPPNPQQVVSVWQQSTIQPDMFRRPLEIQ